MPLTLISGTFVFGSSLWAQAELELRTLCLPLYITDQQRDPEQNSVSITALCSFKIFEFFFFFLLIPMSGSKKGVRGKSTMTRII